MDRREFNPTALIAGLVFIALGVLYLLERLGVLEVSGEMVVPILLVGLGIGIILGSRRREPPPPAERPEPPPPTEPTPPPPS